LIDGAPAVAIDYPSMYLRLLYAQAGEQAPAGDLYTFPGWARPGVKRCLSAMLCRESPSDRFPKGFRAENWFPASTKFPEVSKALINRFPVLARAINRGMGARLTRMESDVLVEACLDLVNRDIGFVPIHDAVLVPAVNAGTVQYVLWRAFKTVAGVPLADGAEPVVTGYSEAGNSILRQQRLLGQGWAQV